jgi:hypothetical protein
MGIAWASVFRLKRQHIYININIWKTELTENSNFRLFAANRRRKRQTSVCFLQTKRKTEVWFLGRQTINSNQHLLFQQTCPSTCMYTYLSLYDAVSIYIYCIYMENGANRKRQLPFVCCKWKNGNSKLPQFFCKRKIENGSCFPQLANDN